MDIFEYKGKKYDIDSLGFLIDPSQWDKDFAEGMAADVGITGGLSDKHWDIINYIRGFYKQTGCCPVVYKTCKANNLRLHDLKELFLSGYQRGACKIAGISYVEGYINQKWYEPVAEKISPEVKAEGKVYRVDVRGFLVDPSEWDENFALHRAADMKIQDGLTDLHWAIIDYLRDSFAINGIIPTVYKTCETHGIDVEELEKLFPEGYHRGAVKIAGLRVR
jgi:tRNA 2-thiouridine synthesizing protein E